MSYKKYYDLYSHLDTFIIISNETIVMWLKVSPATASRYIHFLLKKGDIKKIAPKKYIKTGYDITRVKQYVANMVDLNSYISLYTILEQQVIKQAYVRTFSVTSKKSMEINYRGNILIYNHSKVPQTFGIYHTSINNRLVRVADKERSFLDLLYLHLFVGYAIHTELYTSSLNQERIEEYLNYYPERVRRFYYNGLDEYVK